MSDLVDPVPSLEGILSVRGSALGRTDPTAAPREAPTSDADTSKRFRSVVDFHFAFIWRVLRGLGIPAHSVDDAAQQVFLVLHRRLAEVPVGSERAFLFGTAVGVAANSRRARARRREVLDENALHAHPDEAPNGEELYQLQERRVVLDRVLSEMADELRVVFVLFVLEGLTAVAIADLLSIPQGTVASRLRRARESFHAISKRFQAKLAREARR